MIQECGLGRRRVRRAGNRSRWNVAVIERLERRVVPAGVANVTFAAGTLTITGVDDLTPAGIAGGLNEQSILLAGGAVGVVSVLGQDATTVNGAGIFTGVTAIKLDLKLGNDGAELRSVNITGALTFLGGDGGNVLLMTTGNQSFGSISVTNGDGDDLFFISGSDVIVSGAVTVNHGDGNFPAVIGNNVFGIRATDDVSFGSLKITSGDGVCDVTADGASFTVRGTTQITSGDEASTISLTPTTLTLGGALTVTNGSDFSDVTIGRSGGTTNAKGVTISNGSGGSRTTLQGNYVGAINLTNADGNDELDLVSFNVTGNITVNNGGGGSQTDFLGSVVVTGSLSLTNGAGEDLLGTDSADWLSLNVTGGLTIANGNGAADVRLSPKDFVGLFGAVTVGGNLNLTNGVGDTSWKLQPKISFTVAGSTTITCGEGNDRLDLGAETPSNDTYQAMTIRFGVGDSTVNFTGNETLNGNLTLNAGPGVHSVRVNKPLATKNATFNLQGVNRGPFFSASINVNQRWNVTGNLSITTNHGNDSLVFGGALVVTGTTTISTGTGDDEILFDDSDTLLTGSVSITTGAGQDAVQFFGGATVAGNLTVNTGTLNDSVIIGPATFRGTVSLTLGGGNDRVDIAQSNLGFKSRFEKAVTINGDAGDDQVSVGLANDVNDFAEFLGTLTVRGGAGLDTIRFKNVALGGTRFNIFAVTPSVSTFELLE